MSTGTLPREANRNVALLFNSSQFAGPAVTGSKFERVTNEAGRDVLQASRVPIFRSGQFRDSYGELHTWDDLHMQIMVTNFNHLKASGIFSDVPVRAGHPSFFGTNPIHEVIGYVTNLFAEKGTSPVTGKEHTFVLADFEVLDLEAAEKIESGLWRNRSSEIGFYVTNDEAEFWPTLVGFAYVDIPAVEDLNFSKFNGNGQAFSIMLDKEESEVADKDKQDDKDKGAVQHGIKPLPTPPGKGESGDTGNSSGPSISFRVSGAETSDFSAVQAHIDGLEAFQAETVKSGREAFVDRMVGENRMLASAAEGAKEFANGLTEAQWTAYKSTLEGAPVQSVLGNHSTGTDKNASHGSSPAAQSPADSELDTARSIVRRHRAANMPEDRLKQTESFKKLVAAGEEAA